MSRFLLHRTAGGLASLLVLIAVPVVRAADPPAPADKGADDKRIVVPVKHRSANDIVALLSPSYKGVAVIQAVPNSFGDALLIRAAPSVLDEVVAAVEKLDRPPRVVSVEVLIAEAAPPKEDEKPGAEAPALKDSDFTGPTADVIARMEDLRKKGALTDLKRVQLTVVEGRSSSILDGGTKPNLMGIRSITYRNVGSQVQAGAAVSADGIVTVDLHFSDSRAHTPEDGVSIGADEKGKPVYATEFLLTRWDGKVSVPDGQARAAEDVRTIAKSGKTRLFVVVAAQVVEPEK